jgi:hypothetical protein
MSRKVTTDVDIDVFGRENIIAGFEHIAARIDRPDGSTERHPTGVYFQNIPRDPVTNMSTLDHKLAGEYGYFKIDFLNVNMYEGVRDEKHLLELLNREPPWDFFEYEEVTDKLFHLKGKSHILKKFKPKSVEDLAMVLAIIRPAKAYLQRYDWERVEKEVWLLDESDDGYRFKKSHGIAYALAVIVNLNLLIEKFEET